jgi:hypothetical protein
MSRVHFELAPPYQTSTGAWKYRHSGGDHASICDQYGRPASALPSIAATLEAGVRVGDYVVIATAEGFVGFRAPWDAAAHAQRSASHDGGSVRE